MAASGQSVASVAGLNCSRQVILTIRAQPPGQEIRTISLQTSHLDWAQYPFSLLNRGLLEGETRSLELSILYTIFCQINNFMNIYFFYNIPNVMMTTNNSYLWLCKDLYFKFTALSKFSLKG